MEKIIYPTMVALSYARLCSVNSGYDPMRYGNFGYQATDIPISMPTECPQIKPTEYIDANLLLGTKINNYIDDTRIKTLAQKSAWLGNDATHIVNKHPQRNIVADMKKFIKAMTTMIDAQFAFEDADNI